MPYGIYTVKQTSGWEGRELMKPFDVFISSDGQTYRYLINNAQCVLCRYVDENHTEIDGVLYDTKDFIRRMKHNKISYAPA